MHELVAFLNARLDGQVIHLERLRPIMRIVRRNQQQDQALSPLVELVRHDIAADRKLIARYTAAVEAHEEALQVLLKASRDNGNIDAAFADVAEASAREKAFLAVIEDRAVRFSAHADYQPYWRQP